VFNITIISVKNKQSMVKSTIVQKSQNLVSIKDIVIGVITAEYINKNPIKKFQ
jgi:hypothetical protein